MNLNKTLSEIKEVLIHGDELDAERLLENYAKHRAFEFAKYLSVLPFYYDSGMFVNVFGNSPSVTPNELYQDFLTTTEKNDKTKL